MFLAPKDFVKSPEALQRAFDLTAAQAYTRWLATSHYENFHVVTWMLPKRLHQDFYNVYAFCRWSDDLGDEMEDTGESLRLLRWWRQCLDQMYETGDARHPVMVALAGTVGKYAIPRDPFADLIHAFVQDQTTTRYRTFDELYGYCRYSANPVGRLVLHLCGYTDARRRELSDATCTALQLANFWQDVSVDLQKGRIYMPLELLDRHGSSEAEVLERRASPAFRAAMREAVDRARQLFFEGLPLVYMLEGRLSADIELFSRGGLRILEKIADLDYDVLSQRPAISKIDRVLLLLRALAGQATRVFR